MSVQTADTTSSFELATRTYLPSSAATTISDEARTAEEQQASQLDGVYGNEPSLPPADGGFAAWAFLSAAFLVEGIVWGFPDCFGVFLDAYLSDPIYSSQEQASTLLPLIGPIASGIVYCTAPFITPIINRFPYHRRTAMYLGLVMCWASLFAASYTNNIVKLVALQGVLYAIGSALLYFPCLSYLSEWFVKYRGLANGVLFAGTGAGGIVLPISLSRLITAYGPAKAVRILSIAIVVILLPLLPFVKGRLPSSSQHRVQGPVPRGRASGMRDWMGSVLFWVLLVTNTIQGFGYFVPILWLPTFASDLNLSTTMSSATLAMFHSGSVCGRLSMGYLSDRSSCWALASVTLFLTSVVTFVLWGVFSYNLAGLVAFSIIYGALAGGWPSLWSGFTKPLTLNDPSLSTTLFGILLFSRGIGNVCSTYISSALAGLSATAPLLNNNSMNETSVAHHERLGFQVGGGRFEKMIFYVGACFAGAAAVTLMGWMYESRRSRRVRSSS